MVRKSYIIHTLVVNKKIKELIRDKWLKGVDEVTIQLFVHILNSHYVNLWKSQGWSPIPSKSIERKLRGADWKILNQLGIIQVSNYSKAGKQCREFRVHPDKFIEINDLQDSKLDKLINAEYYNLFTGKPITRKEAIKTKFYDENRNEVFSKIQKKAVKYIVYCLINYREVQRFLELKRFIIHLYGDKKNDLLSYYHDLRCWQEIVRRMISKDDTFLIYQSAWESQSSGRITELGGGLQNASREFKEAMIKGTNYINLDIKGSQVYGAKAELERHNIDTSWFDYYQVNGKQKIANKIGISVDSWKGLLCCILMGGFPPMTKKGDIKAQNLAELLEYEAVRKHICPEVGLVPEWNCSKDFYNYSITNNAKSPSDAAFEIFDIIRCVHHECKSLIDSINQWHDLLFYEHANDSGNNKSRFIARNKADKPLCLDEFVKKRSSKYYLNAEGKRKLAAHILQGKEAAFIHYITSFSKEFGFKVVSNQHDGLIIEGSVPMHLIHNAREFARLPYAELVEKPIC